MATITIRNLPDDLVKRIKAAAARNGSSMEQEVRELLRQHYPSRSEIWARVRERSAQFPPTTAEEIDAWIESGR